MTTALEVPVLDAGPYLLRPYRSDDLPLVEQAAADVYIPLVTTVPTPFTEAEGLAFIQRQHTRAADGVGYPMVIAERDGDLPVGAIGLWLDNPEAGRASIGYWVVPAARGRGAAQHALVAISRWALRELGIARVELFVEPWNLASIRTAERAGYAREGLLRSWQEVANLRRDMLVFSMITDDLAQ
jgi:ribosomal-protein-alanine N-acetyltransferase